MLKRLVADGGKIHDNLFAKLIIEHDEIEHVGNGIRIYLKLFSDGKYYDKNQCYHSGI